MNDSHDFHVVLVHGTWGRRSNWTAEDSYFRSELSKRLGGKVRFYVYKWSGWNSHYARARAAIRLNDFIVRDLKEVDANTAFIVAHSHGGNVVSYATSMSGLANVLAGTVFLGTPFLYFSQRSDLSFWERRMLPILKVLYGIFLFVIFGIIMMSLREPVIGIVVPVVAFSCFFFWDGYLSKIPQRVWGMIVNYAQEAGERAQYLCELYRQPDFEAERIFICQCRFDEASAWLGICDRCLRLGRAVYAAASSVFRYPKRTLIIIGALTLPLYILIEDRSLIGIAISLAFQIYLVAFLLVMLSTFFARYLSRLLANQPFSFGPDKFIDNLVVEITTKKTPIVVGAAPSGFVGHSRLPLWGLNHSGYYLDERAVTAIADWMKSRIAIRAASQ